jgi:hypothetical protein
MEAIDTLEKAKTENKKIIPEKTEFFDNMETGYFKGCYSTGETFCFDFSSKKELKIFRNYFNGSKKQLKVMRNFKCKCCQDKFLPSLTELENYYEGQCDRPDLCSECKTKKEKEKSEESNVEKAA